MGMAAQEAFGVPAVGQSFQGLQQAGIKRFAGGGIVDGLAVNLGGTRAVVEGFGTAFDLQRVNAHLGQTLNVGDSPQIFRVHDVGAVLVLKGGHVLAWTFGFLNHKDFIGRRADAEGGLHGLHRDRLIFVDDVTDVVLFAFRHVVFPAAGVGAGPLVRVALVDIPGEQAAAGVGHAQRAVDENLDLHLRHLAANLFDFIQRQFTRQDHAGEPHLLPEFDRRPVDSVGLH